MGQLDLRRQVIESGEFYIVSTNLDGQGAVRRFVGVLMVAGLVTASGPPSLAQDSPAAVGLPRPYPFGVYRLDTLNKTGPDTSGWILLIPQGLNPGPTQASPSRKRYGLPPLGEELRSPPPPNQKPPSNGGS